jgi:hypothetical protein
MDKFAFFRVNFPSHWTHLITDKSNSNQSTKLSFLALLSCGVKRRSRLLMNFNQLLTLFNEIYHGGSGTINFNWLLERSGKRVSVRWVSEIGTWCLLFRIYDWTTLMQISRSCGTMAILFNHQRKVHLQIKSTINITYSNHNESEDSSVSSYTVCIIDESNPLSCFHWRLFFILLPKQQLTEPGFALVENNCSFFAHETQCWFWYWRTVSHLCWGWKMN